MSLTDLVNIRELQKSDLNFILASSLQCLVQYTSTLFRGWDKQDLYQHLEKVIVKMLLHPEYTTLIACDSKDSDHILGYLCAHPRNNHIGLQYTKYAYRKLGIQKNLLMNTLIDSDRPYTVNWGTKEMVRLHKLHQISVNNKFWEDNI